MVPGWDFILQPLRLLHPVFHRIGIGTIINFWDQAHSLVIPGGRYPQCCAWKTWRTRQQGGFRLLSALQQTNGTGGKKTCGPTGIKILLSVDSTSLPLGTGPKLNEIWHSDYYPVAWTNKKYKMIYLNMGHNDIDYENKTNKTLNTFGNKAQDKLIVDALLWLGSGK